MLAIFNKKEQRAPITSEGPYDARGSDWSKGHYVEVTESQYGAYGLRILIWQAPGAQSRIRVWRVDGSGRMTLRSQENLYRYMQWNIFPSLLATDDYASSVLGPQWSSTCSLRFAGSASAATRPLGLEEAFFLWPKRGKMEVGL